MIRSARQALTGRQQKVLTFINDFIQKRGYPPTLREIGGHFGIRSTNGVSDHLRALERRGYLKRADKKSRALRPTISETGPANTVSVPLLGRVAAGQPILAVENVEAHLRIDPTLLGSGPATEVFGLRVRGDSMIDAGILDGDIVFVRKQSAAHRGDIVVALLGDEATVKYFFPEREHVRLEPANKRLAPILVPKDDTERMRVLGVVVGVYRKL